LISIVVPVYNEEGNVEALLREIRAVADNRQWNVEVIFVDDGSRDDSWARIRALAAADSAVGGIRFQTNAGKAAALMAGFAAARGDVVFMMDADLQDPPGEMPRMLETLDAGCDLVSGWKKVRHDPWHKVYPSRVFNKIIGLMTGVRLHDHVCGLKCFRRPVAKQLRLYGEFHRFIGVLAAGKGFHVTEIATLHRPRTSGVGKYGFARFAKGFLDLLTICCLTRYGWRPQHLIGVTGLWLMAVLFVLKVLAWAVPSLAGVLQGLLTIVIPGLVLIAIGLVAQLITDQRPIEEQYVVAERIGLCRITDNEPERAVSV
jgi:glycosyltransferase involved in cell wall biosynthesis